jgi:hypothetical protein
MGPSLSRSSTGLCNFKTFAFCTALLYAGYNIGVLEREHANFGLQMGRSGPDTLAIYVFSNTDPAYIDNLRFFVSNGIRGGDDCEYIILVQTDADNKVGVPQHQPSNQLHLHSMDPSSACLHSTSTHFTMFRTSARCPSAGGGAPSATRKRQIRTPPKRVLRLGVRGVAPF